ncbi:DEKNAAC101878 [Brettanomyces naardenensis]|uniref:DEKNAAC101878 n=1 Tax=Brettanomyces naardenensis TaxID=13370 RepID=A0A448YJ86_BRENA|nr:DEKNAAC101878 [Brettanomyces naardenensis]
MTDYDLEEPLTSSARPSTDIVLTVRIIKSFPYRNVKNHVFHHVDAEHTTARQFFDSIIHTINTEGSLRPFRTVKFDTIKIYTHAHGTKTVNLVINMDHDDDWVLDLKDEKKVLQDYGIENETELSIYNEDEYLAYKKNPEDKW